MKTLKLDISILMLIFLMIGTSAIAQQEDVKKEKKVVIITKTIDENGNEITKEIIKEGEDADVIILGDDGAEDLEMHRNVTVDVDEDGGAKKVKIRIASGDEDVEVIEWNGTGEMPAEIKEKLEQKGVNLNIKGADDNVFVFKTKDAPNNACLGVMIGKKETVENINGEETTTTEGESELGVPILDIIEGSGAADAGLASDDIITQINGTEVSSIEDVLAVLAPLEAGASVDINYLRGEAAEQVTAVLKACGDSVMEDIEEEIEWIEENGDAININGNSWIFIDEEGNENNNSRKVIIKKRRNGEEVIVEEIESNGEEIEDFDFSPDVENTLDLESIDIFPNPTDGKLRIQFTAEAAPTVVKIVDINGREVYSETLNNFPGKYDEEIDLSNTAKGALIFSIQQKDKVFSEKIILQK